MEIVGILKHIFETQKVSEKFQKRDIVVETEFDTPYPQQVSLQLTQDKVALVERLQPGDMVKIQFNIRGREWQSPQGVKFFNTLEAWRVELVPGSMRSKPQQTQQTNRQNQGAGTSETTKAPVFNSSISDNDDLPF